MKIQIFLPTKHSGECSNGMSKHSGSSTKPCIYEAAIPHHVEFLESGLGRPIQEIMQWCENYAQNVALSFGANNIYSNLGEGYQISRPEVNFTWDRKEDAFMFLNLSE